MSYGKEGGITEQNLFVSATDSGDRSCPAITGVLRLHRVTHPSIISSNRNTKCTRSVSFPLPLTYTSYHDLSLQVSNFNRLGSLACCTRRAACATPLRKSCATLESSPPQSGSPQAITAPAVVRAANALYVAQICLVKSLSPNDSNGN